MQAAVVTGINSIIIQDVPEPKIEPGAILLKVAACSICGSDVRILENGNPRVKYPAIIGHEIAGEIAQMGEKVQGFKIGDKLSVGADVPCGQCYWCLNGMGNCCVENYAVGYQFAGGFAEYCLLKSMVVQHGPICRIPDGLNVEHAALAEPLACCLNGMERVYFSSGKSVLVIGAGPIGILLVQAARAMGASLTILADQDPKRLTMANFFGADHLIDTHKKDLVGEVLKITQDKGVDAVFTACPVVEVQEQALKVVARRGFINFFGGLPAGTRNINISSNDIHYREVYLTGSHGATPRQHALALNLIASGKIDVGRLVTHRYPLKDIKSAFEMVKKRRGLKVLVLPSKDFKDEK